MSRWSASRVSTHACGLGVAVAVAGTVISGLFLAVPASAGTSGTSVKVTPSRGLLNGQFVTISGHGLARSAGGTGLTWFATECTAAVHGRMNPATDTSHCDVTDAQAIRVGRNGSFSMKFQVRTGIVGDGYCGTPGHETCNIGVATVKGQGTIVKITFATPGTPASSTTTTAG